MAKSKIANDLADKAASAKTAVRTAVKEERRRVVNTVRSVAKRNDKSANSKVNTGKLEVLVTIVNRKKTEFYLDLLQSFEVNMQAAVRAQGTAKAQTLHLLGLEDLPKSVIFSLIREDKVSDALAALESKFQTIKDGEGIAYTIPLTSVIGVAIFGFLSNNTKTVKEDKNEKL